MQVTVIGASSHAVVAQMNNGDEIRADTGSMLLLSDGVVLEPSQHALHGKVELAEGAHVSLTHFRCVATLGVVTFAAASIGEVRQLAIHGGDWICARDGFLLCTHDVRTSIGLIQSAPTRGTDGELVFYRLSGHGEAYAHCGGSAIEYDLVAEQRVSVDARAVTAYQASVRVAVETIDGLYNSRGLPEPVTLLTLTGPGKIILSTMPPGRHCPS